MSRGVSICVASTSRDQSRFMDDGSKNKYWTDRRVMTLTRSQIHHVYEQPHPTDRISDAQTIAALFGAPAHPI